MANKTKSNPEISDCSENTEPLPSQKRFPIPRLQTTFFPRKLDFSQRTPDTSDSDDNGNIQFMRYQRRARQSSPPPQRNVRDISLSPIPPPPPPQLPPLHPKQKEDLVTHIKSFTEQDCLVSNPENSIQFFAHWSAKRIGRILAMRTCEDPVDKVEKVFIQKTVTITPNIPGGKPYDTRSIIKFNVDQLPKLLETVFLPLCYKVQNSSPETLFTRRTTHNTKSPYFWDDESVVSSGSLKLRPFFYNFNSRPYIRVWQQITPKDVKTYEGDSIEWSGPKMSLSLPLFCGLIKYLLETMEEVTARKA